MSPQNRFMPYPETRALEYVADVLRAVPTRIHRVLWPVWCVEIRSEVTEGEPYELIDRFLEKAVATAGLDRTEDLAAFLALEPQLVEQALRFLDAIGHIRHCDDGRIQLTELGLRSVRDDLRYTATSEDHRNLYFDGLASRPLTSLYYDERKVTYLSPAQAQKETHRRDGTCPYLLPIPRGFRREALRELAAGPERELYNLPQRIENPQIEAEELMYMPTYVVRAADADGTPRHFVFAQAAGEADGELTAVCEDTPDVVAALEEEEADAGRDQEFRDRASGWLSRRGLAQWCPVKRRSGDWRVTLPAGCFEPGGPMPLSKLGSYVVLGDSFFHVWCEDERVRRAALLDTMDAVLSVRSTPDSDAVAARVERISRRLALSAVGVEDLRRIAAESGMHALANQLGRSGSAT